jgi:hypothetical protein
MEVCREKVMDKQQTVWNQVSSSYKAFAQALKDFLAEDVDRVDIMKKALMDKDKHTAIYLLQYLSQSEQIQLFPELVFLSSFSHGAVGTVRQVIFSMPREWVLKYIEQTAEPYLKKGTYDEYRRFLELYSELDREMTLRLVRRALKHDDPDVREAGADFLNKLNESTSP